MVLPKDAAESLSIPASSLRRYRSIYAEFLSKPDSTRRLNQDDIETLRQIRELAERRFTQTEIEAILRDPPEPFDEGEVFTGEIPPEPAGGGMQPIEILQDLVARLQGQNQVVVQAKDQTIEILKEENDRLRTELTDLRKPWWKKL